MRLAGVSYLPGSLVEDLVQDVEALRRDPTSVEAANGVRTKARAQGALRVYAQAFAERGDHLQARDLHREAIGSLVEAALVYEEELEDLEAAAAAYQKILDIEGDNRRALFALGLLLHDLGRWEDLIALYRRRLDQSRDDGERTTLHLYTAELLSERLGNDQAAFAEIVTAARLAPKNLRIIGRLEKLGERTKRVSEVAVVIGDLILHQEDPRVRAALSLRLAELHLGPLQDSQRALAYLRAALADDGGNPEILSEIEDVFRERVRFDELAEVLEDAVRDRRVGPHRVRLERELARIYELELGDYRRALSALTRAARYLPEDRELLDEILRVGLLTGNMEPVAETFEDVSKATENSLLRTYLRLKLGHIYTTLLVRMPDAVRVYWAILGDDPTHREALRRLKFIHEKQEDHLELARLLELEAQATDGDEAIEALARLARIRQGQLGDREGAAQAWRRVLEIDPEHQEARRTLAEQAGVELRVPTTLVRVPPELVDDLALTAAPAPEVLASVPPERVAVVPPKRVASDGAIETDVRDVLHAEPDERVAPTLVRAPPTRAWERSQGEALEEAEKPEDLQDSEEPDDPQDRGDDHGVQKTAPALGDPKREDEHGVQKVAPELGDPTLEDEAPIGRDPAEITDVTATEEELELDIFERLVRLKRELSEAQRQNDRPRRVEILEEVVRLHERLGQDDLAFPEQVRLAQADPTRERLEDTIRLGRRAQRPDTVIEAVQALESKLPTEARVAIGLALAELELDELRDVDGAVARLAKLCALAPDDVSVFERWTSVLDTSRRFAELVEVLKARAIAVAGTPESLALIRRAARVCEVDLSDARGAVEVLTAYLEQAPEREELRQEAAELLEKAEAWPELVELHEAGLTRLEGQDRADARLALARLYRDRLRDPLAAERVLRDGLEERARDPAVLAMLEELYESRGAFEELVGILIRRLDVLKGAGIRNSVRRRIATIAEEQLGDGALVLEVLGEAVREDPTDIEVLFHLERVRRGRGELEGVRQVLLLRRDATEDPVQRAGVIFEIASIDAQVNGDLEGAREDLLEALALAPGHREALGLLASVEERRGQHEAAIAALRRLASEERGKDRAAARVRLGRIYELVRGDVESAADEYQAACEADPRCLDAILGLFHIREAEGRFTEALELVSRAAALVTDGRERAELFRRAGAIALDRVGDELKALEAYENVLVADPEDLATMARLGELYFRRGNHERALPLLEKAAEGLSDPAWKESLYRAAGSAAEKLERQAVAILCYEGALAISPRERETLERLSALMERTGRDPGRVYDLSALLILHHERVFAPGERAQIYLRMARMKHAMKDFAAVVRLAKKAHQLETGNPEPLSLLADALEEHGDPLEAAEALRKIAQLRRAPREKRDALFRAAELLAERANDVARASAMLAEAQVVLPEDVEVARLLATHRETLGDARGAVLALLTPAKLLTGRAKADLLARAAKICAGIGRDRARAKALLTEAVGLVPTHEEALEDLRLMLEFDGQHEALVELEEAAATAFLEDPATARDAHDLDRRAAARALLTDALRGHRSKLRDPARALRVARKLVELSPDDGLLAGELADLLDRASAGAKDDESLALTREAIGAWSRIVEDQPGDMAAVARLGSLYGRAGERELARATAELCAAMGGEAPTSEEAAREEPSEALTAVEIPSHPLERTELETLWNELGYAPIRAFYDALPEPKPKRRDLVAPSQLKPQVARPLAYAVGVLGVQAPAVYFREDALEAVSPVLVLDQPALMLSPLVDKLNPLELRFLLGRALSLLRPRALALVSVPLDVLREGLAGIARPLHPAEAVHADPRNAKKRGRALEKLLSSTERYRLAEEVGRWLGAPDRGSLAKERFAVLRTADRAGLVTSGSLLASLATLAKLSHGRMDRAWRIPLIEWAASRGYASTLRRLFGL